MYVYIKNKYFDFLNKITNHSAGGKQEHEHSTADSNPLYF